MLFVSTAFVASADSSKRKTVTPHNFDYSHPSRYQLNQLKNHTYFYNRGVRLFDEGKLGLAEISFKEALGGTYCHYQANAYLGLTNIKQNDHKSAVRYLRTALKGNPDMYGLKSTLGLSYIEIGKPEKAKEILSDFKTNKDRLVDQGSDAIDLGSSIAVLEQALSAAS
jgi:tetratricopeptide (TPR) repeat protein